MLKYSKLRPADILLEINFPGSADEEGARLPCYRTISDVVIAGKLELTTEELAPGDAWASAFRQNAGQTQEPGDNLVWGPETKKNHPIPTTLVERAFEWMRAQGIPTPDAQREVSVGGCWASPYHEDGVHFSSSLFGVVWMAEEAGLDLVFPHIDVRVPLSPGVIVVFDPGQPHGVLWRNKKHYASQDYACLDVQPYINLDVPGYAPEVLQRMGTTTHDIAGDWKGLVTGFYANWPAITARTGAWRREHQRMARQK